MPKKAPLKKHDSDDDSIKCISPEPKHFSPPVSWLYSLSLTDI